MDIRFNNYRFNQEQHLLYKDETLIELKTNQAALLELFLLNPDKVFSKDDIMDQVWKDKVVSEQVVFQNISQLRAIFGSDAIKTFSKKGYQWQIAITPDEPVEDLVITSPQPSQPIRKKPPVWQIGFYLIVLSLLTYFYQGPEQSVTTKTTKFHLVKTQSPSQQLFNEIAADVMTKDQLFSYKPSELTDSVMQIFMTPKLAWQKAKLNPNDWLIWGDSYSSNQGIFLHYGLSKEKYFWQGYLFAANQTELNTKFSQRLQALSELGLFSYTGNSIDLDALLAMLEQAPNDADILLQLAERYVNIEQFDVALAYLQRIVKHNQSFESRPHLAQAHWLIGKIYKIRSQHSQALASLDKMSAILDNTMLTELKLKNIKTHAWLALDIGDFEAMYRVLEQGLAFGKQQDDPLVNFELHILYSILAKKAGDHEKKYHHLNEAQALLLKHQLDQSNLAVVYFHFALFTQDNDKAIPYLQQILTINRTGQNYWIIDGAFEMLIEHYIEQKAFDEAHLLFSQSAPNSEKLVLQAKLFNAENKPDKAKPLLEQAYEMARLEYNTQTGLQAALMLFQIETKQDTKEQYLAYMESNASQSWLNRHTNVLAQE